ACTRRGSCVFVCLGFSRLFCSSHARHHFFCFQPSAHPRDLHSFPTRRSSDLNGQAGRQRRGTAAQRHQHAHQGRSQRKRHQLGRSEEHTSELQSRFDLVCRLLLEKKKLTFMISIDIWIYF